MEHPDPKKHLLISLAKSVVRIAGCGLAMITIDPQHAVFLLASSLALAEGIGIIEELV